MTRCLSQLEVIRGTVINSSGGGQFLGDRLKTLRFFPLLVQSVWIRPNQACFIIIFTGFLCDCYVANYDIKKRKTQVLRTLYVIARITVHCTVH